MFYHECSLITSKQEGSEIWINHECLLSSISFLWTDFFISVFFTGTTTGGVFLLIEAFPSGSSHHGWLSIPAMAGLFSLPRSIGFVPLFLDAGKRCLMCHAVYCCAGLHHPYLAAFRRQVAKFIAQISESNIICRR